MSTIPAWQKFEKYRKKTATTSQLKLERALLIRKRWQIFMKLGRMVEGYATRPWCESHIDQPKWGAIAIIWKINLNRHISCPIWPRVMKLCTDVHLLIPNTFPIKTYQDYTLHFWQITLLWKMLKEAVCSFLCHLVVKSKWRTSATQFLQSYTHLCGQIFKQCLFCRGTLRQHP